MKVGDLVRVVGVPPGLPADREAPALDTVGLFNRCVGRVFPIVAFNALGHTELEVGEIDGLKPYLTSIWVEPKFLLVEER